MLYYVQENTCLTSLNVVHNKIGDEGAKGIGEGLKVNACCTYAYAGSNMTLLCVGIAMVYISGILFVVCMRYEVLCGGVMLNVYM